MFEKAAKLSQLFFFVWSLDLACYGNFSPSQIPENVTTLYCNISGGVANFGNNPTFVGGEHGACESKVNTEALKRITTETNANVETLLAMARRSEEEKRMLEEERRKDQDTCWVRFITKWWHQASGVQRAAALAVCGLCGYSTVKELGGLLFTSKDKLVNILTPVFGRYHLTLNALKPNCIKLFLKAGNFEEFRHWLIKTEDYSFQRELCFAMEEASNQFEEFDNTRVPFNPEHFHLVVFSLDGTEIKSENLAKYTHKVAEQGCKDFLLKSARVGKLDDVETAIEAGVDINTKDMMGETALHKASSRLHNLVVELLLERGAKIDLVDKDGETALHKASSIGYSWTVPILLERGANMDLIDKDGETALHKASSRGNDYVVDMLVKRGAKIDLVDKNGETALHKAARHYHKRTMDILIKKGIDVNVVNKEGRTAEDIYRSRLMGLVESEGITESGPSGSSFVGKKKEYSFTEEEWYTKQKSDAAKLLSVAAKREGLALYETEKMLEVGQPADLETKGKRLKMELPTELEEIGHPESERKPKM